MICTELELLPQSDKRVSIIENYLQNQLHYSLVFYVDSPLNLTKNICEIVLIVLLGMSLDTLRRCSVMFSKNFNRYINQNILLKEINVEKSIFSL